MLHKFEKKIEIILINNSPFQVNYIKSAPAHNRTARQAYGDEPVVGNFNTGGGGSCSGCCQPGPAGPVSSILI